MTLRERQKSTHIDEEIQREAKKVKKRQRKTKGTQR